MSADFFKCYLHVSCPYPSNYYCPLYWLCIPSHSWPVLRITCPHAVILPFLRKIMPFPVASRVICIINHTSDLILHTAVGPHSQCFFQIVKYACRLFILDILE